ncbi:MAG TPA: family 78 glycoside hydrolase catalytic domain [Chthonomonadales bacterium]|nr:family 78 glycoside hydrolase catalytic domain [Chthonomonadales bacterium]
MRVAMALVAGLGCASATAGGAGRPEAPVGLRCEHLVSPLAVEASRPRLSWEVRDPRRGAIQSAYRILVASSPAALAVGRGDLWDSGKVSSRESLHIAYSGRPLTSFRQCWWKVRTWDGSGRPGPWSAPAYWRMGLLRQSDWRARWIEDPAPAPAARGAHNGFHSPLEARPDAEAWVMVDLGSSRQIDGVRLFPARPYDWREDVPGFLFPLRYRVEASAEVSFAEPVVVADRTMHDQPGPGTEPVTVRFAPVTARWVRLMVTHLRAREPEVHAFALAEMEVLGQGRNLSRGRPVQASGSIESGGWSIANLVNGNTASHPASGQNPLPAVMLRGEFQVPGRVVRATAYASALGLYELRLNGHRVGDHILAPEWTSYWQRVQYQAYDVTRLVRRGANAVGVWLADGWYAGRIGLSSIVPGGPLRGIYGRKPRAIVQVRVELADGRVLTVGSGRTWRSTTDGPIRAADILDGEEYDARRAAAGWDRPGYSARGWRPVALARVGAARLVAQPNEPIRVMRELPAVAVTEPRPGVFVFDLGQNMVGWARLRLRGVPGRAVTLVHAEMLNPDGSVYTANLRGAAQTNRYTPWGTGAEVYEPRFTYHGFRYVQVEGLAARPRRDDLVGRVFWSSSPEVGAFASSNALVNRLWRNIVWTQRANLMSTPTDCPQRDERLGWMGDIQVFGQTAMFHMDLAAFFTKWLRDVRDDQARDGRFPDFAPHPFGPDDRFSGAPAWADAGVLVPWDVWVNYADRRLIEEHLPAARRWVDFVASHNPDGLWRNRRGNDYSDWLNGDTIIEAGWPRTGGAVPPEVLATAFHARSADLVARMSVVVGRPRDAARYAALAQRVRAAFLRAYVDRDGRIQGDTQAGYALALAFDLLPARLEPAAFGHMLQALDRYGNRVSTGIQTTHRMMLELTRRGRTDLAHHLLLSRAFPSWLYSVDQGATTIWERWDGYVRGRGFQDPGMNSFNHWALGAVGEWMWRTMAGLSPDPAHPGWAAFVVQPRPGGGIGWVRARYRSPRGEISVAWRHGGGRFDLRVTVPANVSAVVWVPTSDPGAVTEGGAPAERVAGVRRAGREPGAVAYRVGGGTYRFDSPLDGLHGEQGRVQR